MNATVDILAEAWRGLVRHPLRSALSAFGVAIALAAIVAVLATEQSWQETVQRQYEKLGTNQIVVGGPPPEAKVRRRRLQVEDAEAIRRECPAVQTVDVMLGPRPVDVKSGRDFAQLNAYQVGPSYLRVTGWPTTRNTKAKEVSAQGCWLSPFSAKVLLGDDYRKRLPQTLRIEGRPTPLNGLVAVPSYQDQAGEGYLLLPLGSDRGLFAEQMVVIAASARDVRQAAEQIDRLMSARLGSKQHLRVATGAWRMLEEATAARARLRLFTGVALVCILMVAILGVANMLLASVEERTREVALRRALGAQARQVMGEVLCESALVSVVGGALGCALAYAVLHLVQPLLFPGAHFFMSNAFRPEVEGIGEVRLHVAWQAVATGWAACSLGALAAASVPAATARSLQPSQALALPPPRRQAVHRSLATAQVLIGVCAAVVLMSLYAGLGKHSVDTLRRISRSDVIELDFLELTKRAATTREFDEMSERRHERLLSISRSLAQIAELRRRYQGIGTLHLRSYFSSWPSAKRGRRAVDVSVAGIEQGLDNEWRVQQARLIRGRELAPSDEAFGRRVCVINDALSTRLFGSQDPVGRPLRIAGTQFLVIGIMHRPVGEYTIIGEESTSTRRGVPYEVLTPISAIPKTWFPSPQLVLKLRDPRQAPGMEAKVEAIFQEVTNLESDYQARWYNRAAHHSEFERRAYDLALRAALIGSAGFWVALVGLVNMLFTSFQSRVREIGLLRALGATRAAIASWSVLEGLAISVVGAALGLGAAAGLAAGLGRLADLPVAIPPAWAAVVLGCTVTASCLAALLPAAQAASVPPSVALRYE